MYYSRLSNLEAVRSPCLIKKLSRVVSVSHKRALSTKDDDSKKKYSSTVYLPKTTFPGYIKANQMAKRDQSVVEKCGFNDLYQWQKQNLKGSEFVLHDGPPYANGSVHLGHAVNKVLKDIANRERLLAGHRINYVPGWDCHGLPIELKAIGEKDKKTIDPISIRIKSRKFSEAAIKDQEAEFKSWGVMADWDNKYKTSSPEFVKNQLKCFQSLYDRSLVFRDLKPVYWSPVSQTALAESELVYKHDHKSLSVFVSARLVEVPPALDKIISSIKPGAAVNLVIWTSTVWSLPANQAVAYGAEMDYCIVESQSGLDLVLIAQDLLSSLSEKLQLKAQPLATFKGTTLQGSKYMPMFGKAKEDNDCFPLVSSTHVTNTAGTGLVHIAPCHGQQDFLLALEHKIPLFQSIDESMEYTRNAPAEVQGLNILEKSTMDKIMSTLDANLMYSEPYVHSYPYDWRAHCPVIMLASKQWFLSTETLRQKAEESLARVNQFPIPDQDPSPMVTMLRKRPYWCISRQRVWGIPIPAVYHKKTGQAILHKEIIDNVCSLIDKKGPDCWWQCSVEEIVPESVLTKFNVTYDQLELGKDILDIWFDSGLTWSMVLGITRQADLCIEGADQYTAWFQTALLLSTALQARAPYKNLQTHGFVVDGNGLKMSKSVGNVIHPQDLTKGTKKKQPLGIDILRFWIASQVVGIKNIPASEGTFKAASEMISKIRNVAKFLLGNVGPQVDPTINTENWRFLDRLLLHRLYCFQQKVNDSYRRHVLYQTTKNIFNFVNADVSNLYCHAVKDRLYCDSFDTNDRQQCVQVLTFTLETVLRAMGPIVPHLAEEICMHWPERGQLFYTPGFTVPESWNQPELEDLWEKIQPLQSSLNKLVADKNIQEFGVTLQVPTYLYTILKRLQPTDESWNSELCELFHVAAVALQPVADEEPIAIDVWKSPRGQCLRCRRYTAITGRDLCDRCEEVVAATLKPDRESSKA